MQLLSEHFRVKLDFYLHHDMFETHFFEKRKPKESTKSHFIQKVIELPVYIFPKN